MGKGQELYQRAKQIIPGGTQLLSKRPELFLPDHWPSYYSKAQGSRVWDMDGVEYTDMSYMGIGASVLGYADPDVDAAVKRAIDAGNVSTLNPPEEVELADVMFELHPWASMIRYARSGGEALSIAIRIARASSRKDKILFCGYHGWHDWYLASNLADDDSLDGHLLPGLQPRGVPRALTGTTLPFNYNDTEGFLKLVEQHKDETGVVVMEPLRNFQPEPGFLETIREVTRQHGIVFILDEVSSGFRLTCGGAHRVFNIEPDLAVFAKALGNGYPIAAVIGTGEVMQVAEETFISSTNWTDKLGPVSALATIRKYKENKVHEHLDRMGGLIQEGWRQAARNQRLDIGTSGIHPLGHFAFNYPEPLVLKTLFTQLMLEKGFLATTAFYASYAHSEDDVTRYLTATEEVFGEIKQAIEAGNASERLAGPVSHAGFRRLT